MKLIIAIACGGALGAVGRYFVSQGVMGMTGSTFPLGTLAVNVVGSFIMGCLVEAMAQFWSPSLEMKAFLTVGILGAFTTFSTFSLDVALLSERGALGQAALYIILSFALSVGALFAGLWALRSVMS